MRVALPFAAACLGLAALVACAPDGTEPATVTQPTFTSSSTCGYAEPTTGEVEEEVFGTVQGLAVDGFATLRRFSPTGVLDTDTNAVPINRLLNCHKSNAGGGHANEGADFGWYSAQQQGTPDGHCQELERHREEGDNQFPNHTEEHCIGFGKYLLQLGSDLRTVRPIDYFGYVGAFNIPGDFSGTAISGLNIASDHPQIVTDVITDYSTVIGPALTPLIEISPKPDAYIRSDRWNPIAPIGGVHRVPLNYTLRMGAWKSQGGTPSTLVRYFWNCCDDTSFAARSGFTSIKVIGRDFAQVHRYSATGTYTLKAHLIQPWHMPATAFTPMDMSYGLTRTMVVNVYDPLTATIAPSPSTAPTGTSVTFTAGGSNGSGGNQYRWEFGDGTIRDFATSATAAHSYTTAGQKTVVLRKRDQYGYENTASMAYTVTAPVPPLEISIWGDHTDQLNIVAPNQTCRWMGGSNISGTTFAWYRNKGGWFPMSTSNPLSLAVKSAGTSHEIRVIGTAGTAKDTLDFTVTVSSGGASCGAW